MAWRAHSRRCTFLAGMQKSAAGFRNEKRPAQGGSKVTTKGLVRAAKTARHEKSQAQNGMSSSMSREKDGALWDERDCPEERAGALEP